MKHLNIFITDSFLEKNLIQNSTSCILTYTVKHLFMRTFVSSGGNATGDSHRQGDESEIVTIISLPIVITNSPHHCQQSPTVTNNTVHSYHHHHHHSPHISRSKLNSCVVFILQISELAL